MVLIAHYLAGREMAIPENPYRSPLSVHPGPVSRLGAIWYVAFVLGALSGILVGVMADAFLSAIVIYGSPCVAAGFAIAFLVRARVKQETRNMQKAVLRKRRWLLCSLLTLDVSYAVLLGTTAQLKEVTTYTIAIYGEFALVFPVLFTLCIAVGFPAVLLLRMILADKADERKTDE
jgi:hypothetical protein